ncbi:MAG: hypothetical protein ACOZNI_04210 [Myxococcota bacterium]
MASSLLLLTWLAACGTDPARMDAVAYQGAMGPILQKNRALAQELLETASEVKKGTVDGPAVATRVRQRVIPAADSLKADVAAVKPATPELAAAHATLVKAWTARAEAWHAIGDAYEKGDLAALEAARARDLASKDDEAAWVTAAGAALGAQGLRIELYP